MEKPASKVGWRAGNDGSDAIPPPERLPPADPIRHRPEVPRRPPPHRGADGASARGAVRLPPHVRQPRHQPPSPRVPPQRAERTVSGRGCGRGLRLLHAQTPQARLRCPVAPLRRTRLHGAARNRARRHCVRAGPGCCAHRDRCAHLDRCGLAGHFWPEFCWPKFCWPPRSRLSRSRPSRLSRSRNSRFWRS